MRLLLAIALIFVLAPWARSLLAPDRMMGTHWPGGGPQTEVQTVLDASGERVRHGRYRAWHENGAPSCEGTYRRGLRTGTWRWWHEMGEPLGTCTYDDDAGAYTSWTRDGRLHQQGPLRGAERDGIWTEYYPSGRVHLVGGYRLGRQHGRWTFHTDEDPPRTVTSLWDDGRRIQ